MSIFTDVKPTIGNSNEGVVTVEFPEDSYFNGTDIPKKVLKQVFDYNKSYIAEASSTAGELSREIMEKDKNVTSVVSKFPYSPGKAGSFTLSTLRSKEYRNPATGEWNSAPSVQGVVKDPFGSVPKSLLRSIKADIAAALQK